MKFFKTHSDHELKRIKKTVKQILELQPEYAQLSDEQLKSKTEEFKQRLKEESLNDLLPEAYAAIGDGTISCSDHGRNYYVPRTSSRNVYWRR